MIIQVPLCFKGTHAALFSTLVRSLASVYSDVGFEDALLIEGFLAVLVGANEGFYSKLNELWLTTIEKRELIHEPSHGLSISVWL